MDSWELGNEDKPTLREQTCIMGTNQWMLPSVPEWTAGHPTKKGLFVSRDVRTSLRTPRAVTFVNKCGGRFVYFGIEGVISKILAQNGTLGRDVPQDFNIVTLMACPSSSQAVDSCGQFCAQSEAFDPLWWLYITEMRYPSQWRTANSLAS